MSILALDPGYTHSALVRFDAGRPLQAERLGNGELITRLRAREWLGDLLAVESMVSYGMPVGREVLDTCVWIGRFIEAWAAQGGRFRLVERRAVKLALCHSARATDANVRAAIIDHYGSGRDAAVGTKRQPGPLYGIKGDCWSALAVAMTVGQS